MPAPDYTAEITALEGALAKGQMMVSMPDGRRVQYQTAADIRERIGYFKVLARGPKSPTTYATFCR